MMKTTTKKVIRFYGKNVEAPPKQYTLCRDRLLIRPWGWLRSALKLTLNPNVSSRLI